MSVYWQVTDGSGQPIVPILKDHVVQEDSSWTT